MGKGGYETVGSPSDVSFVDPTGQYQGAMDHFTNESNFMRQNMGDWAGRTQGSIDAAGGYMGAGAGMLGRGMGYMDQAMTYSPDAYMNQFLGQQAGLANVAQGATAPLGQSLSAIAERNAVLGGEAALASMPGARHSGAAMAAFGDAYASPFAQAAAQTQQAQLGLTGQLWNQAMGANAQAQQYRAGLAGEMGALSNQMAGTYGNFAGQQLNAAGIQQGMANMYGGLYGQNLGQYGQMAQGMGSMFTPQYEYRKGFGDRMWDLGGMAAGGLLGRR